MGDGADEEVGGHPALPDRRRRNPYVVSDDEGEEEDPDPDRHIIQVCRGRIKDKLESCLRQFGLLLGGYVRVGTNDLHFVRHIEFIIRIIWARETWDDSWERIQQYVLANTSRERIQRFLARPTARPAPPARPPPLSNSQASWRRGDPP